MNLRDIETEMIRLSRLLDNGITELVDVSRRYAIAEDEYRMARARSYMDATGTVEHRRAMVDLATSTERVEAHTLDGLRKAMVEAVRSRRQQMSALQTLAAAHKAEAEFVRTGP